MRATRQSIEKQKQTNKQNINVQWRQQDLINLIPLSSLAVQFLI